MQIGKKHLEKIKRNIMDLPIDIKCEKFDFSKLSETCAEVLQSLNITVPSFFLYNINPNILNLPNFGLSEYNSLLDYTKELNDKYSLYWSNNTINENNWVDEYLSNNPDKQELFKQHNITNEATYLEFRSHIDEQTAEAAENYRYDYYYLRYNFDGKPFWLITKCPTWLLQLDIKFIELNTRISNFFMHLNISCLKDLENYTSEQFLRIENFGRLSLRNLAESIHVAKIKGKPISNDKLTLVYNNLYEAFTDSLNRLEDTRHRYILEARFGYDGHEKTLEEVGQELGITRERVRQIQTKQVEKIKKTALWVGFLEFAVLNLFKNKSKPLYVDILHELDAWFDGFKNNPILLKNILDNFVKTDIKFLNINGRLILSHLTNDTWQKIKTEILNGLEHSLNIEHTIEDIEMLIDHKLAVYQSQELSALMLDEIMLKLNFSFNGEELVLASIGNSFSSHLQAILNEMPEPLHYSEITKLYEERFGVDISERNVHARLNHAGFLLFERGIYGSEKHITLYSDEQNKIRAQAEQFLLLNSHKQCHSSEILASIKDTDINIYVLNIILSKSNQATYLGKSVWKFRNDEDENIRYQIKDIIINILQNNGQSMHIDMLQQEIVKIRGVSSYFAMQLTPNEVFSRVDPSHWGLLSRDFILSPEEWEAIKEYYIKHLTQINEALHQREVFPIFQRINHDDRVTTGHIMGVLASDNRFRRWQGGYIGLAGWDNPNRATLPQAINQVLAEIKSEDFTTQFIADGLNKILHQNVEKSKISAYLKQKGYVYDSLTKNWH